jgi:hypothetical protein
VDAADVHRDGRVPAQRLEVREHARPAVGDLPPHLGLVDELGLQDALDRLIRGGFRRRPGLGAREVRAQIGARRLRGRLAPEHDAATSTTSAARAFTVYRGTDVRLARNTARRS